MLSSVNEEYFTKTLHRRGYRLTPQRLAILRSLIANQHHPSAQELFQSLQPDYPTMSLTTVYNTMSLFVEMGLVKEIKLADGGIRYDVNREPHINLYCRRCQTIFDMTFAELADIKRSVLEEKGFTLDDSVIELSGVCKQCQMGGPYG